jgi:hypothetical protein
MRPIVVSLLCSAFLASGCGPAPTPRERLDYAVQRLSRPGTDEERFYALNTAAKGSLVFGNPDDARRYAEELSALTPRFKGNWNYGNAIQDSNVVLGRIAVAEGRIDDAKRHLLGAGASPGSPQMDTFGPNMSLAKDLAEKGERDTVLAYLELCRRFWKRDGGKLDRWSRVIESGRTPDFGANVSY